MSFTKSRVERLITQDHISAEAFQHVTALKAIGFKIEFARLGLGGPGGNLGAAGALFLSQAVYETFQNPTYEHKGKTGWFTLTQAEWFLLTGLSDNEQKTVRDDLKRRGFLEEATFGVTVIGPTGRPMKTQGRLFYRVNVEAVRRAFNELVDYMPTWLAEQEAKVERAEELRRQRNERNRAKTQQKREERQQASAQEAAPETTPTDSHASQDVGSTIPHSDPTLKVDVCFPEDGKHVDQKVGNMRAENGEAHLYREVVVDGYKVVDVKTAPEGALTPTQKITTTEPKPQAYQPTPSPLTTRAPAAPTWYDDEEEGDDLLEDGPEADVDQKQIWRELTSYVAPEEASELLARFGVLSCEDALNAMDGQAAVLALLERMNAERPAKQNEAASNGIHRAPAPKPAMSAAPMAAPTPTPPAAPSRQLDPELLPDENDFIYSMESAGFGGRKRLKNWVRRFGVQAMIAQAEFVQRRLASKEEHLRDFGALFQDTMSEGYGPLFENQEVQAMTSVGNIEADLEFARQKAAELRESTGGASPSPAPSTGTHEGRERARELREKLARGEALVDPRQAAREAEEWEDRWQSAPIDFVQWCMDQACDFLEIPRGEVHPLLPGEARRIFQETIRSGREHPHASASDESGAREERAG